MKKFVITDNIFDIFPDVQIGVVVCTKINNRYNDGENSESNHEKRLRDSEKKAAIFLTEPEFSSNPVIKSWREAFQKFKTKKGARSSIEALMKRIEKMNNVGTINPLVDIYNEVSLSYGMPCGGEDMDQISGDIQLTMAKGDEPFIVLGSEESSPPFEGEIVYKDNVGAICRCWNWREGKRTMLTEDTRNAFMCIELVDISMKAEFENGIKELEQDIKNLLGAECRLEILNKYKREIDLI